MRKKFFALLLLFSYLSAEDEIKPYLTSECDSLSLIEGVVNARNGKLVQIEQDLVIQGSDPLRITRYYDGGHHYGSHYGYGFGLSLPTHLCAVSAYEKLKIYVEQRMGSAIPYLAPINYSKFIHGHSFDEVEIDPAIFDLGYTNCVETLLQGEPSIFATKIKGNEKKIVVTLGDGTKRHYIIYFKDKVNFTYHYRLELEERPNRTKRHFRYLDESRVLTKMWTTNREETLTLNAVKFSHFKSGVCLDASNGQSIVYNLESIKGKAKDGECGSYKTHVLSKVTGEHVVNTSYEFSNRAKRLHSLFSVTQVYRPNARILKADYDEKERVSSLRLNSKLLESYQDRKALPIYAFKYDDNLTTITNALGGVKNYAFTKKRLTSLSEGYRAHEFKWDERGQLVTDLLKDADGTVVLRRKYQYDDCGNIVEAKLVGSICASDSLDRYIVTYTYSTNDRYLLLHEDHNHGEKEIEYRYLPNTNLLMRKLLIYRGKVVEREYYTYDSNGILITKITDDGSDHERNGNGVTYRHITEFTPQLDPGQAGITLPKIIAESYWDPKTGEKQLLKRLERTYTQGDLLAREKVFNANGDYSHILTYSYNDKRQLISETNALGEETLYQYNDHFLKSYEEKVGSGKKTFYEYNEANQLVKELEEHADGTILTTTHRYDSLGNRLATTNPYKGETAHKYDRYSHEICTIDPLHFQELKDYDCQGNVISHTDKDGFVTKKIYNIYGKPLEIRYPDETLELFTYNLQGHLVQKVQRDGTTVEYTVDYQGRPLVTNTIKDGLVLKTVKQCFKGTNLISETDGVGNVTHYTYDAAGRKIAKTQGGVITNYTYNAHGQLWKTQTPDRVEIKEYDLLDRVIEERIEDLNGQIFSKIQYSYDINGNKTRTRTYCDPLNYADITTQYDSQNHPILLIDALGNQTKKWYRQTNHLEVETLDPLGRKKVEIFDPTQQLSSASHLFNDTLLAHTSYEYDGRGHQIRQTDEILSEGSSLGTYTIVTLYDSMGDKVAETEQGQKTTAYTYINGRMHTLTQPDGVILTHAYDPLGRLKKLLSSDGTIYYTYVYDLNDNLLEVNDHIQHLTIKRAYDSLNQILSEQQATGLTVTYQWDTQGRVTQLSHPYGKNLYAYSPSGLISASRQSPQRQYTYTQTLDWRAKPIHATFPNRTELDISWDNQGRCIQIASPHFSQHLVYDPLGNLTSSTTQDSLGSYTTTYTYDLLNQLTSEDGPFSNTYAHDSLHNRRTKNSSPIAIDSLNQLTNDSLSAYTYDPCGRRLTKNQEAYSYDALGRLLSYNGEVTYRYDPLGRLIERQEGQHKTQYLYQFDTEIGALEDGLLTEYRLIHGKCATVAIEQNGQVITPIRNFRGDICLLLDSTANPIATSRYDAFGLALHTGQPAPWQFFGQRFDPLTKLYHFDKREYDPSIGRWLTPDPLGFVDGPNLYAYVHNNPLIYIDPYGLWKMELQEFSKGFSRGFVDDFTWGASEYALGTYQSDSLYSNVGYGAGTLSSIIGGCYIGTTQLKVGQQFGKGAITFGKQALAFANMGVKTLESRQITNLAGKSHSAIEKITRGTFKGVEKEISLDKLSKAGEVLDRSGLTRAGRALDKHGGRQNSVFPKATGNSIEKNLQGQYHLEDILTNPKSIMIKDVKGGVKFYANDGKGAHFREDGTFKGFIERQYE